MRLHKMNIFCAANSFKKCREKDSICFITRWMEATFKIDKNAII